MSTKRILIAVALVLVALYTQWLTEPDGLHNDPILTATPRPAPDGSVRIARVIDGDTIELEGGTRVRFIGVDTPEVVDSRKAVQCFGPEASANTKELLAGGSVILERDITDTDVYGRLLRYVYLPDGTFVNLKLVADGYAYANTYPPDVRHAEEFVAAQAAARAAGRGLWGSCPVRK